MQLNSIGHFDSSNRCAAHQKYILSNLLANLVLLIFFLNFLAAMALEITEMVAAISIGASALGSLLFFLFKPVVSKTVLAAVCFLAYAALSAFLFGGIESLYKGGLLSWLSGEGRLFLYYWPMIFLMMACRNIQISYFMYKVGILIKVLTVVNFLLIIAKYSGVNTFSSHHAAGAVAVSIALVNYQFYRVYAGKFNLMTLLISCLCVIGSGSRTAVVAILVVIVYQLISMRDFKALVRMTFFVLPIFFLMPVLFPTQYERLSATFENRPVEAVWDNFKRGWMAYPPLESPSAWALSSEADLYANANLAIRGLLWARGLTEGLQSPIVGAGFGRYNDTNRVFEGEKYFFYPAISALGNNYSDHSAHNSILSIFAELGLIGLFLLWVIVRSIWRKCKLLTVSGESKDQDLWVSVAKGAIVLLVFFSITQHSFGAPIYGLTLMQLVALGSSFRRVEIDAD